VISRRIGKRGGNRDTNRGIRHDCEMGEVQGLLCAGAMGRKDQAVVLVGESERELEWLRDVALRLAGVTSGCRRVS